MHQHLPPRVAPLNLVYNPPAALQALAHWQIYQNLIPSLTKKHSLVIYLIYCLNCVTFFCTCNGLLFVFVLDCLAVPWGTFLCLLHTLSIYVSTTLCVFLYMTCVMHVHMYPHGNLKRDDRYCTLSLSLSLSQQEQEICFYRQISINHWVMLCHDFAKHWSMHEQSIKLTTSPKERQAWCCVHGKRLLLTSGRSLVES